MLAPTAGTTRNPAGTTGITDVAGNYLSYSGYNTAGSNYSVTFSIAVTSDTTTDKSGAEILVNQTTAGVQTTTSTGVNAAGDSASTRNVACDDKGDYAVVWLQYAADGTTDVYMRLFNSIGNPLSNETLVNSTFTAGNQTERSVAMDADGDFVVVWASQGEDPDGSWGIYGKRFSYDSTQPNNLKAGAEFRVNTIITNDQLSPAVAMDNYGDFVVVWASQAQSYSYFNTIKGQIYDLDGNAVGTEFQVAGNVPSTGLTASNNLLHPSIAMSERGNVCRGVDRRRQPNEQHRHQQHRCGRRCSCGVPPESASPPDRSKSASATTSSLPTARPFKTIVWPRQPSWRATRRWQ